MENSEQEMRSLVSDLNVIYESIITTISMQSTHFTNIESLFQKIFLEIPWGLCNLKTFFFVVIG